MKNNLLRVFGIVIILSMVFTATVAAQAPTPGSGATGRVSLPHPAIDISDDALADVSHLLTEKGPVKVMVELEDLPSTVTYANSVAAEGITAATGLAVDQLNTIQKAQKSLTSELTSSAISAQVIYSAQRVYNGIAVEVDSANLAQIAKLPGVKAIHPLTPKVVDNAYSVPLIGAPETWTVGLGTTGAGIKVGVIDTGIDYLHTNFGGPGTGYDTNDTTVAGDAANYPGTKVAGGYDFVGDDYDANVNGSLPVPDSDPMDCYGHGSHVAGTIAGYGVNSNGTTYAGSYGAGTDFASLKIGPGVAPEAELYSLRVFGCEGSTNVVTEAIDWAVDPNGDGDFSDHLDVINMSLGSDFGSTYDVDSVASDNAVLAGVIVVASAGNSGDTYYVAGSPGDSTRAVSVAASVDSADTWDGFEVIAPAAIEGVYYSSNSVAYDWLNESDVTGDVVYPDTNQNGCGIYPAGTFTGKVALIDWDHDAYGNISCGSATKANHALAAGAIGVIMAEDIDTIDTAITGSAYIPATLTTKSTGDAIKAALGSATVTVRFSKDYIASVTNVISGQTDTIASFSSRGVTRITNFLKPDITAPGYTILSTRALSGTYGESMNGTSMAAPHVAGVMALLRQLHPTWSVEELKALAMNTAAHEITTEYDGAGDIYNPARIGAGRVDVYNASQNEVVMYNAEDGGAVSVSFGAPQVLGTYSATKLVTIENKGGADVTYDVSFEDRSTVPGVTFSLLDSSDAALTSVTIPAGDSVDVKVKIEADAAEMLHTHDLTVSEVNIYSRHWLSEASGLVILSSGEEEALRLPVYAAPRPVSAMEAAQDALTAGGGSGTVNLTLTGTGVDTTSIAATPYGEISLVTALEQMYTSVNDDMGTGDATLEAAVDAADLQYVGAAADTTYTGYEELFFGFSSYGEWSTPNAVEYDVYLDVNQDGTDEYVLINYSLGAAMGSDPTDVFLTFLIDLNTSDWYLEDYVNYYPAGIMDTVLYNNSVMVMPVYFADLGITPSSGPIDFSVVTWSIDYNSFGSVVDMTDVLTFDPGKPAVDTGYQGYPMYYDQPGTVITTAYDHTNWTGGVKQMLLLHHHNAENRAEVVDVWPYGSFMPVMLKGN